MGNLKRSNLMREDAKRAARLKKAAASLSRTGQVARSSISVRDDEVMLDELMAGAVDTAEVTVEHSGDLGLLDDAAVTDFGAILDAGGAADVDDMIDAADAIPDLGEEFEAEAELAEQNHVAHMLAIEATQNVDEAREKSEQAAVEASLALTTANGKNARRTGLTQPDPPEGGWVQGDQWMRLEWVDEAEGITRPAEVLVWNGEMFVRDQLVVDSLLAVGEDGNVYIDDGKVTAAALAADAVDAKTIRGAQFYGGYIEAPVIASSEKLGSGANLLNDPQFLSTVDTAWVASGHLGDASVTQRDTITWNQSWTMTDPWPPVQHTYKHTGSVVADLKLTPAKRKTGSIVMANYSWFSTAARTFSNPYKFVSPDKPTILHGQYGGSADPSFKAVAAKAPGAGTARTTYLTNSAVVLVEAGQRWNIRLGFTKLTSTNAKFLTGAAVEVIDAVSNAVVFTYAISQNERLAGQVNTWWVPAATHSVKYRIRATYTAGGGGGGAAVASLGSLTRKTTTGSYARRTDNGVQDDEWVGSGASQYLQLGGSPSSYAPLSGTGATEYNVRGQFAWEMESAVFAQVEPQKGWRLTEESGLEIFNSLGQNTAALDGQDNFFSGRIGTSESGERFELASDGLAIYDATGVKNGVLGRDGTKFKFTTDVTFKGDTDWASISFVSPHTGTCQWRRYHGMVQVRWECTSTIAANELVNPLFVVPEQITPAIPASATLYGNGGVPYTGRISSNRNAQIRNNGTAASGGHSGWCEYPAN